MIYSRSRHTPCAVGGVLSGLGSRTPGNYADGMTAPKPRLRWFQFSLRTLLVFVTLCAIPCSWLAVKMRQAERQRAAATAIEKLGGYVVWSEPSGPACLLGDDFSKQIEAVYWSGKQVTDAGLENLKGLTQLQGLNLGGTKVTDTGLENLKGLNQLQWLSLGGTKVTDAGLENLEGLNQLESLNIDVTEITDAGLEHLKGLKQLQELWLVFTKVTDAGVKKLRQALPELRD